MERRKKILLIDDDISTMDSLKESLESFLDYEVEWVKKADDVIAYINSNEYDVIILDIMMPIPDAWSVDEIERCNNGMATGNLLLEKIQNTKPEIPVLVLTATRTEVKQNKKLAYLRKPEATDVIDEKISELINS